MALNADLVKIAQILAEEGFGSLAGELITEVSLGKEVDLEDGSSEQETGSSDYIDLLEQKQIKRDPIPEDRQVAEAVSFLKRRLVEPAQQMAEAERLAADLVSDASEDRVVDPVTERRPRSAIRIEFIDNSTESGRLGSDGLVRSEQPGDRQSAERLSLILDRIYQQST